jgi:hypothetical protein
MSIVILALVMAIAAIGVGALILAYLIDRD